MGSWVEYPDDSEGKRLNLKERAILVTDIWEVMLLLDPTRKEEQKIPTQASSEHIWTVGVTSSFPSLELDAQAYSRLYKVIPPT